MATIFSPAGQRYLAQPAASAPTAAARQPIPPPAYPVRRFYGGYTIGSPVETGDAPPNRPPLPVDQRPIPPEPPRRTQELLWLTWQLPERVREPAVENLRQTLGWRAQYCQPLDPPETPVGQERFGLVGEELWPRGAQTVRKGLREEVRESVRVLEGEQPRLERNRRLAMHSARLGQLCEELEQRGIDALEEVRCGLAWLWN